jgi:hypothetical protein
MKGHFVRPIEVREDAVRARKKEIEAEVQRIMSLPDDKRADEIFKMVDALPSERRAFVEAYMRLTGEMDV